MKKKKGFLAGVIVGVIASVSLIGAVSMTGCSHLPMIVGGLKLSEPQTGEPVSKRYNEIETKLEVLQTILDQYYLSDQEVSSDEMVEGIYKGFIDALGEPYTVYYTAEEYAQLQESTSGKYSGIGVVVSQNVTTGVITVVRPFEGSPGQEAGMQKDDLLYKIDDKEVTGVDVSEVVTWIKGEEGTTVTIEVYRQSEDRYITMEVERRTIEVPMVEYQMLDNGIGYIEILEFEETTAEQFNEAYETLEAAGLNSLIIDLRDNPGGLLGSAVDIIDRILPENQLVVYTENKAGERESLYTEDNETIDVPIAVLVNEHSASASEIVSGCLQDYERATLIGDTTFGKGIVQYVLPLNDGSAIKLTSANYYTPEGRNIHGIGIEPDINILLDKETDKDEQLEKAIEVLDKQEDKKND